ncbi:hypothetical protein [Enterococcus sp. AZ072]
MKLSDSGNDLPFSQNHEEGRCAVYSVEHPVCPLRKVAAENFV